MSKTHIKRDPECGFLDVVKYGKRNGHIRYHCKNCGSYFTDRREHISDRTPSYIKLYLQQSISGVGKYTFLATLFESKTFEDSEIPYYV